MSDTQVVKDQELVSTMEEDLSRTGQGFAGRPSSPNGKVASPPSEPTVKADPRPRRPGMVTRVVTLPFIALKAAGVLIFEGLREVYWALDRDAKVRSQGVQTVGRVVKTTTEKHEDSESGVYYTHTVRYDFNVDDRWHNDTKKVSSLGDLKRDGPIRVYYLPGTYPLASAVDTPPRALGPAREELGRTVGR